MAKQGRWGITREPNGDLADLWSWPWFWRYPAGILILVASVWLALFITQQRPNWVGYALGGCGVFIAMGVMYELGLLAVIAGGLWLISTLADAFVPNVSISPKTLISMLVVGVIVLAGWVSSLTAKCNNLGTVIEHLKFRLTTLEGNPYEEPTTGLAAIDRRVYALEDEVGIYDPD